MKEENFLLLKKNRLRGQSGRDVTPLFFLEKKEKKKEDFYFPLSIFFKFPHLTLYLNAYIVHRRESKS